MDQLRRSIVHVATLLVILVVFAAARHALPRHDLATGSRVLEYPVATKALGWFLMIVLTAVFVGVVLTRHHPNGPPFAAIPVCFVGLLGCLCLVLEFTRTRIAWTDHEITLTSPWTGDKRMLWTDVEKVRYSPVNQWFVVTSRMGVTIRVHGMLGGVSHFLSEVQARLPQDVHAGATVGFQRHGSV